MLKKILIPFVIASVFLMISIYSTSEPRPDMEWTMVNVNYSAQQADAHVIKIKDGKTILIDAGHRNTAKDSLLPFLIKKSIDKIDIVFISHPHKDHYGGLDILLDNDIKINEIYFNIPGKSLCDQEIPGVAILWMY